MTSANISQLARNSLKARLAVLGGLVAMTLATGSEAVAAGNVSTGRDIARRACAECHRLPNGAGGGEARALTAYSDQQPFTAAGLRKLIGSWPHAGRVKLPPDQAYPDLAAFLNGIGKTSAAPARTQTERTAPTAERPADWRSRTRQPEDFGDERAEEYEHDEDEAYEDEEYEEYEDD